MSSRRATSASARRRRRRAARRALRAGLLLLLVLAVAVVAVVALLRRHDVRPPVAERCSAALDGTRWHLSTEQADNAALIAAVAERRGLPPRAVSIALATALQESKLSNIDYGDRDSLGLFQQRPSQGWGTPDEILDPVYSTNEFYDVLVTVADYPDLPITEAAQRVQRSAFPDAYAQHETRARAWASALTGQSPGQLTCTLNGPTASGDPDALRSRVARDYGDLPVTAVEVEPQRPVGTGAVLLVDARALSGATGDALTQERDGWAVAQWAVAVAAEQQIVSVRTGASTWTRATAEWDQPAGSEPLPAGTVQIGLADVG